MRYGRMLTLSDVLATLLRQKKGWKRGIQEARLRDRWEEIVGPVLARYSQPTALLRGRLMVHCEHDTWRTELQYMKPELLKRIAEVEGEGVVKDIFLK